MFNKCNIGSICYFVSDIEKTESFYKETLGLDIQRMDDDGEGNAWLSAQMPNDLELIFFKQESQPGNSPIIVFDIAEGGIDDIVAGLAEKGVTIVTPVSHAPGGWSADIADPDGHSISMYQSEDLPKSLK
ncbi:MAG: VOC family protein [Arenicella sp.]